MVPQKYDMKKENRITNDKLDAELSTVPNDKYQKFFGKFDEIETLSVAEWRVPHLLGYFCKKWKAAYQTDYHWKFNNQNPNKCFEVWQMNTLVAKLSAKPQILKDYIDWVFDNVVPKKSKLRSISFMTDDRIVIPYKMNVLLGDKKDLHIDRSTPLPSKYRDVIEHGLGQHVETYGDLAFLHNMYFSDPQSNACVVWMGIVHTLESVGFDTSIIGRIV
jgi:hypothetical protein